jgi:hypothetical protein
VAAEDFPRRDAPEIAETQSREIVGPMLLEEVVLRLAPALQPDEQPYVTMESWLDHAGRDDLIDCIADDFERRRPVRSRTGQPSSRRTGAAG